MTPILPSRLLPERELPRLYGRLFSSRCRLFAHGRQITFFCQFWLVNSDQMIMCELDAAKIELSNGLDVLVDLADVATLNAHRWGAVTCGGGKVYACRTEGSRANRKRIYMHRFIIGGNPTMVDHINGNSLDNRRQNLRVVSAAGNAHNNLVIASSTGFRCVWKQKDGFAARVEHLGRRFYLGFFETDIEAAFAVNEKLDELRPGFGARNEIDYQSLFSILEARKEKLDELMARINKRRCS